MTHEHSATLASARRRATVGDQVSHHALFLRSYKLEAEIERLLREGEHELAVIVSQTLLELRVEADVTHFMETANVEPVGTAALELLTTFNLGNGRTQKFIETLTGVRLFEAMPDQMHALREHGKRRNAFAHRGIGVSAQDARASFETVKTITQAVHELTYKALGLEDDLEEERRQEGNEDGEDERGDDSSSP